MRRREFISVVFGTAVMWPLTEAWSQEVKRSYQLGILVQAPRNAAHWTAFFDEMRKNGFTEGVNLSVIDGFNTSQDRAEPIAKMIVVQRPDVMLTAGVFTKIVQQETKVIPILTVSDDLLAEQAVASLAHPGANTTGISILATELDGKRQEILLEAVPLARRIGILVDPSVTQQRQVEQLTEAAGARGVSVSVHRVVDAMDIIPAMDAALAAGARAVNVLASSLLNRHRARIIAHAAALRLPAIYQWPEMAEEGGLMAYGPRFVTLYRQHARQVQRVLEGASPADIPVEQPTTFGLVINLRVAGVLGLSIPPAMLFHPVLRSRSNSPDAESRTPRPATMSPLNALPRLDAQVERGFMPNVSGRSTANARRPLSRSGWAQVKYARMCGRNCASGGKPNRESIRPG